MSSPAPSLAAETRVARHKVFLPAEMVGPAGTIRVHLLNLSGTGALAHGEIVPAPGSVIQLRCGDTAWLARIVWARGKRFGLVHSLPLGPSAVEALLNA